MSHMEQACKTCGKMTWFDVGLCNACYEVEENLEEYLKSPKGQDFVRQHLPRLDNWPEWDYEAVLRENEVSVVRAGDYWYGLGWRHGSESINADNEVIARKSAAVFVSLWLCGVTASFADNLAHGFAMWLELQDQRYSFELTKELGNAVLKLNSCRNIACMSDEEEAAWDKLVESARLCNKREQ